MPSACDADAPSLDSQARSCQLVKTFADQEYGFDLHAEKARGQFIGNVDSNSPAGTAGLKSGDRILAINGVPVGDSNHKEVVRRIKEEPLECRFIVIDEPGFLWYSIRHMSVPIPESLLLITSAETPNGKIVNFEPPKSNGEVVNDSNGNVLHHDQENSPSPDRNDSQLRQDQSCTVTSLDYEAKNGLSETEVQVPVSKICCDTLTGLTQDRVGDLAQEPIENIDGLILDQNEHLDTEKPNGLGTCKESEEELPRLCHLVKSLPDDEYGFNLHAEKNKGHFVGKVDAQSIAQQAGLVEGYRIVGANGTLVYPKTPHKDVVLLIRLHPLKADLLIASPELDAAHAAQGREFSFDRSCSVRRDERLRTRTGAATQDSVSSEYAVEQLQLTEQVSANRNAVIVDSPKLEQKLSPSPNADNDLAPKVNTLALNGSMSSSNSTTNNNDEDRLSAGKACPLALLNGGAAAIDSTDILRMSASEMREKVLRHKKVDPRKESMPIREKYEIIKNL